MPTTSSYNPPPAFGPTNALAAQTRAEGAAMGYQFPQPARYWSSHAEVTQSVMNPGAPIGVSNTSAEGTGVCGNCYTGWFQARVNATGNAQVIAEPNYVHIIAPNR